MGTITIHSDLLIIGSYFSPIQRPLIDFVSDKHFAITMYTIIMERNMAF